MRKIISIIVLGAVLGILFLPQNSKAVFLISACSTQESTADCQKRNEEIKKLQEEVAEQNRILQEKVTAQKEAEAKAQEQVVEQQRAQQLQQQSDSQLKIIELENRIIQLEKQNSSGTSVVKTKPPHIEKPQITPSKKQEVKNNSDKSTPVIQAPETPQILSSKIGWLKRFINWFRN